MKFLILRLQKLLIDFILKYPSNRQFNIEISLDHEKYSINTSNGKCCLSGIGIDSTKTAKRTPAPILLEMNLFREDVLSKS